MLCAIPVLAVIIIAAFAAVQVPGLDIGWWSLLGGIGNPVTGSTERTVGTAAEWLVPLVFLGLLLPALPLFAEREEQWFRLGAERRTWLQRRQRDLMFGLMHALVGIPIGVALVLAIGGAYFTAWVPARLPACWPARWAAREHRRGRGVQRDDRGDRAHRVRLARARRRMTGGRRRVGARSDDHSAYGAATSAQSASSSRS